MNIMTDVLSTYKRKIEVCLDSFLQKKSQNLSLVNRWGPDAIRKAVKFLKKGKMIRGGLILMTCEFSGRKSVPEAVKAAAAMELFHSAFLVHDDIMDNDTIRRGLKSIHYQYEQSGLHEKFPDSPGYGRAMGICAGDILIFMAYELLASMKISPRIKSRLTALFSRELAAVGPAQMQDVYLSKFHGSVKWKDVYKLYTYKTARYTFSLPLLAGSVLMDRDAADMAGLSRFGEYLGVLFQIKDDEIGQFGTRQEIGKPVGSDIKEGKKTLYFLALQEKLTAAERKIVDGIYGKSDVTPGEIRTLNRLMYEKGVPSRIGRFVDKLYARCLNELKKMKITDRFREALWELTNYNLGRRK